MRTLFLALLGLLLAALAPAQDKVTLANGDVLTGTIKSMADGKLVIESTMLGEVTVEMAKVANIATAAPVDLLAADGTRIKRRIAGIEGGQLRLEGAGPGEPSLPSLPLASLSKINPVEDPPATWDGSLTIGGLYTTGNTDRRTAALAFEAIRRTELDRITVDAAWNYGEEKVDPDGIGPLGRDWNLSERKVGGGFKYDYFLTKKLYLLATSRVQGDTLADIELRFTAGAGLGYQVLESDTIKLGVEAGVSYFYENYRSATPSDDYMAARLAYRLQYDITPDTRLIHALEAFPSLEDADDVYFRMDTRLQTKLFEDLIAQLGWVWDYDNTPAPARDRSDHTVSLTIGWKF